MLQSDRCGDHFLPFVHPIDPAGRADHRIVKYHQLRFGVHKAGQRGVPAVHRTPQAVGQHDLLPGKFLQFLFDPRRFAGNDRKAA